MRVISMFSFLFYIGKWSPKPRCTSSEGCNFEFSDDDEEEDDAYIPVNHNTDEFWF